MTLKGKKITIAELDAWLARLALFAALRWRELQCANVFGAYYLYHRPGELAVFEEVPPAGQGWELSSGERIRPNWTVEQVTAWIGSVARKLPICVE